MAVMRPLFGLLPIILLAHQCAAYSRGAPDAACNDLTPRHRADPQTSRAPYQLLAEPTRLTDGTINVTIVAEDQPFKGFIIQARSKRDGAVSNGVFVGDTMSKTVQCGEVENTATHRNKELKQTVRILWKPPAGNDDMVEFQATVVQSAKTFWTNIRSSPVQLKSSPSQLYTNSEVSHSGRSSQIIPSTYYDECASQKLCFGMPSNCIKSKNCKVLMKSQFNTVTRQLLMELHGILSGQDHYMAVGISTDAQMGDDSVAECYRSQQDGNIHLRSSYNFGRDNKLDTNKNKVIQTSKIGQENGVVSCRWRRDISTTQHGKIFDAENSKLYLLLAMGALSSSDEKEYHNQNRMASSEALNMTLAGAISGAARLHNLTKAHGCLMILAWIGCASLGIIIARHGKDAYPNKTLLGTKVWFTFHRGLMGSVVTFGLIAMLLVFIHLGGWAGNQPHPLVGASANFFMSLQVISALLRCHPGAPRRWVFNTVHWLGGNIAHILAITAIFLSTKYLDEEVQSTYLGILIAFVLSYVTTHVTLEIRNKTNSPAMNNVHEMNAVNNGNTQKGDEAMPETDDKFRSTIVGLFAVLNCIFVIALWAMIISSN